MQLVSQQPLQLLQYSLNFSHAGGSSRNVTAFSRSVLFLIQELQLLEESSWLAELGQQHLFLCTCHAAICCCSHLLQFLRACGYAGLKLTTTWWTMCCQTQLYMANSRLLSHTSEQQVRNSTTWHRAESRVSESPLTMGHSVPQFANDNLHPEEGWAEP